MSDCCEIDQIISNLEVIKSIVPGKTLSTSTMTLIDHKTWSTAGWRWYAGESRKTTIAFIDAIFIGAINYITKIDSSKSMTVISSIKAALDGFMNLRETYSGDAATITEIEKINYERREDLKKVEADIYTENIGDYYIEDNEENKLDPQAILALLKKSKQVIPDSAYSRENSDEENEVSLAEPTIEECIDAVVKNPEQFPELISNESSLVADLVASNFGFDQKNSQETSSNSEKMVQTSNREGVSSESSERISSPDKGNDSEGYHHLPLDLGDDGITQLTESSELKKKTTLLEEMEEITEKMNHLLDEDTLFNNEECNYPNYHSYPLDIKKINTGNDLISPKSFETQISTSPSSMSEIKSYRDALMSSVSNLSNNSSPVTHSTSYGTYPPNLSNNFTSSRYHTIEFQKEKMSFS